jgi:hydrogenase maturation protease
MSSSNDNGMKTLVLGLGNELLGDDAIGPAATRILRRRLGSGTDVVTSSQSGLALFETLVGYDRAIIIDAIQTGKSPPGTIHELTPADLDFVQAPSPHYAGLPEMFTLARELQVEFPQEILILAIEAVDASTIGGKMSAPVRKVLPQVILQVERQVAAWAEVDLSLS